MINGESEDRRYVERNKLEIDRAPNESIRCWILGELKMNRKLKNTRKMTLEGFNGEVKNTRE